MARLDYVDLENVDTSTAEIVERIRQYRGGRVGNLDRMMLHSPALSNGWPHISRAIRIDSILNGHSRELAICRVGQLNRADYEWHHHVPVALREGITEAQLAALDAWQTSNLFTARDRAVLAYADAMTRDVSVSDDVFQSLHAHFSKREIVELTATVAFYNMVSRFLVALGVTVEGD